MESIEILNRFITEELVPEQGLRRIDESQSLLETGILDSLSIVKLLAFIEETFEIRVDDQELVPENFETLRSITDLICQKRGKET